MATTRTVFTASSSLCFLLLILQQASARAQLCSASGSVDFRENNTVGEVVASITVRPGVELSFNPPPSNPDNPFTLDGSRLIAARVLDYETKTSHTVSITCQDTIGGGQLPLVIVVIVKNINDNPPAFEFASYDITISEVSPVGSLVASFPATDPDDPRLVYTLTPESTSFALRSDGVPDILVNGRLDYDTVQTVQLVLTAHDAPLVGDEPSYTATATIDINISDGDNRPPWFQPCTLHSLGLDKVCQSPGYTSWVVLNELQAEALTLKPGPVHAIDGDSAIREEIRYSFLSGNEDGLFEMDPLTGDITMVKAADVLGSVVLTVLAAQAINSHQFATAAVNVSVQVKSLHRPRFQRPRYEGVVSSVGSMALDAANKDAPLRIVATDDDYLGVEGINPNVAYAITGSGDFSIVNSYLFMVNSVPDAIFSLQVTATDRTNDESATSELTVEVKAGVASTALPTSGPGSTSPPPGETTTKSSTTGGAPGPTVTFKPTASPSASDPAQSTAGGQPAPSGRGQYGAGDMAALGATLGVLLFLSLLAVGLLVHWRRTSRAESKKLYEASVFRSSLNQDGPRGGVQYTNEAFQHDEDPEPPGGPGEALGLASAPAEPSWSAPSKEEASRSSAPQQAPPPDDGGDAGSVKTDDKEVKPILTKERRAEEGYKSVWFKEDIDPNAKEEVVIIPDSDDGRDEDEEDEGEDLHQERKSKVMFSDSDMDSGLGVKFEDPADESDSDKEETMVL